MILAAGFGTRARPLTHSIPKALLPVFDVPLLEWSARWLLDAGVRSLVVNAHHLAGQVEAWARTFEHRPPRLRVVREPEILGTAGGIAGALPFLASDPVLFYNVDLFFRPDLEALLHGHRAHGSADPRRWATLVLVRHPLFAQVRVEDDAITEIRTEPDPADPELWAFSGVYLLSQAAARSLPGGRFESLTPYLCRWAEEGRLGAFLCRDRVFREVGTLESYWELHRRLHDPPSGWLAGSDAVRLERIRHEPGFPPDALWVSPEARVDPEASVPESILLAGSRVRGASRLERCIAGPRTEVDGAGEDRIAFDSDGPHPLRLLTRDEEARLRRFLQTASGTTFGGLAGPRSEAQVLHGDGSERRVVRVFDATRSAIVLVEPETAAVSSGGHAVYPQRAGNAVDPVDAFAYLATHLARAGVRVPALHAHDRTARMLLIEDGGDRHLETVVRGLGIAHASVTAAYESAVDQLLCMQQHATPGFEPDRTQNPDYDEAFALTYEVGYFERELLRGHLGVSPSSGFEGTCISMIRTILEEPRVLMHRDFQSRNLLVRDPGVTVIDFQGARLGPRTYDLASLLYDPYVALPETLRAHLLERFIAGSLTSATAADIEAFRGRLELTGLLRLLQAMGAFAFLGGKRRRPRFLEHLPAALHIARGLASRSGLEPISTTLADAEEASDSNVAPR